MFREPRSLPVFALVAFSILFVVWVAMLAALDAGWIR